MHASAGGTRGCTRPTPEIADKSSGCMLKTARKHLETRQKAPELSNSPAGSAREHAEQQNGLGYHADVSSARADAPGIGNNTQTGRKTSECSESTRERKTHPKCSKSSDPGLLDDNEEQRPATRVLLTISYPTSRSIRSPGVKVDYIWSMAGFRLSATVPSPDLHRNLMFDGSTTTSTGSQAGTPLNDTIASSSPLL